MLTKSLDQAFGLHENALRLRTLRQEVLAANIANADTPNYKARDFDFNKALTQAMQSQNQQSLSSGAMFTLPSLYITHASHVRGSAVNNQGMPDPKYRKVSQPSADGNTVDMDIERNQFAENSIRYEASLSQINGKIKTMLAAIQG